MTIALVADSEDEYVAAVPERVKTTIEVDADEEYAAAVPEHPVVVILGG